jgi:transcriptional regulator with XRE-family HTH domain
MIETPPFANCVMFAGRYVKLSELSRQFMLDHSYLSRILSGQRYPSLKYALRVAEALDMGLEEFLAELDKKKAA